MAFDYKRIESTLVEKDELHLFLDYDGTLADFAPTPDVVKPDLQVIDLLKSLRDHKHIHVFIISGRKLAHLQKLIPLEGIVIAGTYGLEIQMPDGEIYSPIDYNTIRPALDRLKPKWQELVRDKETFYLEDKGWTLALHARFANDKEAGRILASAEKETHNMLNPDDFQIVPGHKFLEASPKQANKGKCAAFLLKRFPPEDSAVIYIGDDDKDKGDDIAEYPKNLWEFVALTGRNYYDFHQLFGLKNNSMDEKRTIEIDDCGVSAVDFDIQPGSASFNNLFESGRKAVQDYFNAQ